MSHAQFEKALKIIKDLPSEGAVKPTQDDQLHFYGSVATFLFLTRLLMGFADFSSKQQSAMLTHHVLVRLTLLANTSGRFLDPARHIASDIRAGMRGTNARE